MRRQSTLSRNELYMYIIESSIHIFTIRVLEYSNDAGQCYDKLCRPTEYEQGLPKDFLK